MDHTPPPPLPADLLERYLANEVTAEEQATVAAWAASGPKAAALLETLRGKQDQQHGSQLDVDRGWATVSARFQEPAARTARHRPVSYRSMPQAGMLLAVIGLLIGVTTYRHNGRDSSRAASTPATRYATVTGQRATITLRDGSRVILAPASVLLVDAAYGTSTRRVTLHGEGYFEVIAAQAAPFIVQTGRVTTHVLGTTFDVRRYSADNSVHIAVISGKVRSQVSGQIGTTIVAGQVAAVTDSTAAIVAGDNASAYTNWTRGQLTFTATPLPEVLHILERWYGVQFRLADSTLSQGRLTAGFEYGSRADMLANLTTLLDVTYTLEQSSGAIPVITLHAGRALKSTSPLRRQWRDSLHSFAEMGR